MNLKNKYKQLFEGRSRSNDSKLINEADVFLTGDISHRYFLLADDNGLGLVQVNHISTEIPGMSKFVDILANELNIKVKYFYPKLINFL